MPQLNQMATSGACDGWSRHRLLAIMASAGFVALLLVSGFGYAVFLAIHSAVTSTSPGEQPTLTSQQMNSDTALGEEHRDQIAAQPMLTVDADAMKPTTPTTQLAKSIEIPEATSTGPDDVPTGFPHTPEGAIGQLAAMSQTVLSSMSVSTTQHVYDDWAMAGGVGADDWQMTANVTSFLGAAGMGPNMSPGATVSAIPAGAQVKGTDGPDWTVACVLFEVDATISSQSSIGYGTCERMQWNPESGSSDDGGRWMIAPGTPPMPAPNTWPGSALALKAGWLTWTTAPVAVRTGHPVDKAAANAPDNPSGDGAGTTGDSAAN
ncbi:MAG: hypothetical protein ACRDPM_18775 [Solirubrobacteraceae bacterium]